MSQYTDEFYASRDEETRYAAEAVLSVVLERIPRIGSAVDLGCGVGTWLAVLADRGVDELLGLDGPWVDPSRLVIPRSSFRTVDLGRESVTASRRYDLALSLEVAEHLPVDRAEPFVASLAALSDRILFSAAVPFQGGVNHLNERWQHYWAALFAAHGYAVYDFVRPAIWTDERIPYWYRQNVLYFSRAGDPATEATPVDDSSAGSFPLDLVHPRLYLNKIEFQSGLVGSFWLFRKSVWRLIRSKVGKAG